MLEETLLRSFFHHLLVGCKLQFTRWGWATQFFLFFCMLSGTDRLFRGSFRPGDSSAFSLVFSGSRRIFLILGPCLHCYLACRDNSYLLLHIGTAFFSQRGRVIFGLTVPDHFTCTGGLLLQTCTGRIFLVFVISRRIFSFSLITFFAFLVGLIDPFFFRLRKTDVSLIDGSGFHDEK